MKEKKLNREIVKLCQKLSVLKNIWAITGGANHYLRNIVTNINDIDIITNKEGGAEIANILSSYVVKPYKYTISEEIKSYYAVINYKGIIIEIMADPINHIKNEWVVNRSWESQIEKINFLGCSLPVTTLNYETDIYALLCNTDRVKLLCKHKLIK